jgi:hypothetical protein
VWKKVRGVCIDGREELASGDERSGEEDSVEGFGGAVFAGRGGKDGPGWGVGFVREGAMRCEA